MMPEVEQERTKQNICMALVPSNLWRKTLIFLNEINHVHCIIGSLEKYWCKTFGTPLFNMRVLLFQPKFVACSPSTEQTFL